MTPSLITEFQKILGVEVLPRPLHLRAFQHALSVLKECSTAWALSPLCLTMAHPSEAWEDLGRMFAASHFPHVDRLVAAALDTQNPTWLFLFHDVQLSCLMLAEKRHVSDTTPETGEVMGFIRFDSELVEQAIPRLLETQPEPLRSRLISSIGSLGDAEIPIEHRQRCRAEALERFAEHLSLADGATVPEPPPEPVADTPPPISISYIEELLGISGEPATEQETAAIISRVVNAIARLTDYQLVLVSLFKEEFPYRDIIGCEALSLDIIQRLSRTPFTRDEFRRLLRNGVPIRVGGLGIASYFPPSHHRFIDVEPLYKSQTPYTGGQGHWDKHDELFVPIIGQSGEYLGVISLDDPRSGRAPDAQSLLPVTAFARQISLILERQRVEREMEGMLYQLSVNNSELAGLNTVLEMTSRSMDRQGVLEGALKTLEVVDLEAAAILTLDDVRRELQLEHVSNVPENLARAMYDFGVECFTVGLKIMRGELEVYEVETLVTSSPRVKQTLHQEKIQTLVSIPLYSRNGVLGVMVLWSHDKRNFSPQDCRLLLNIGKQVGLAIEANHLFERSQRLASQMTALFEVGKSITYHLALEPLLNSVTQNAADLLNADQASVILLDDQQAMTAMASYSRPPESRPGEDSEPPELRARNSTNVTLISVPITTTNPETGEAKQIGIFSVARNTWHHRPFSQIETEMLGNLTSHVSIAVTNARAYEAERKRSRQLMLINSFLREISAILDSERMLEHAAQVICDTFSYLHVSITMYDDTKNILMVRAAAGSVPETGYAVGQHLAHNHSAVSKAIDARQSVKVDDLRKVEGDYPVAAEARSRLAVPIMRSDNVLGVLLLEHKDPGHFDKSDVLTAEILADGLGVALRNAELYSEVISANAQLQDLIRVKDDLVSMVAHDFRSPLTTIQAFSEVLSGRTQDAGARRYLEIINRQSRHLARLANDTLTMSRLESKKMNFEFQPVNVREMIELLLDARFGETNVTFETKWPETPLLVSADAARLQEVFDNLIGNAVKYSPNGGTVEISTTLNETNTSINIRDQGIGISSEDMPRLFEKFQRMENARKLKIPGTGLGLYICHSIVEAHGGKIEVDSELGKGSTFRVVLPRTGPED